MRIKLESISIKERIFYAFLTYSLISFVISVSSFVLFRETEKIDETALIIQHLKLKINQTFRYGNEFYVYEANNEAYYKSGQSIYLQNQADLRDEIYVLLDSLITSEKAADFNLDHEIIDLRKLLVQYNEVSLKISKNLFQIGFKDEGLIGNLRNVAHKIEKTKGIDMIDLLTLRRLEKDYFLRFNFEYISNLKNHYTKFKQNIKRSNTLTSSQKTELIQDLDAYNLFFEKIVALETETGFKENKGMSASLKNKVDEIGTLMQVISIRAEEKKIAIMSIIRTITVIMVTLSVVLSLLLGISYGFITKKR